MLQNCFAYCSLLQVSDQPRSSAERRATAPLLVYVALQPAAVDRYHLPARRSAANPPHAAAVAQDGSDRKTDGHRTVSQTLLRIDAGSANDAVDTSCIELCSSVGIVFQIRCTILRCAQHSAETASIDTLRIVRGAGSINQSINQSGIA